MPLLLLYVHRETPGFQVLCWKVTVCTEDSLISIVKFKGQISCSKNIIYIIYMYISSPCEDINQKILK